MTDQNPPGVAGADFEAPTCTPACGCHSNPTPCQQWEGDENDLWCPCCGWARKHHPDPAPERWANWYATRAHYAQPDSISRPYRAGRSGMALCSTGGAPVDVFDQRAENHRTHTGKPKRIANLPLCKKCARIHARKGRA